MHRHRCSESGDGRPLAGRLPSRARGGAKPPLAAAWAANNDNGHNGPFLSKNLAACLENLLADSLCGRSCRDRGKPCPRRIWLTSGRQKEPVQHRHQVIVLRHASSDTLVFAVYGAGARAQCVTGDPKCAFLDWLWPGCSRSPRRLPHTPTGRGRTYSQRTRGRRRVSQPLWRPNHHPFGWGSSSWQGVPTYWVWGPSGGAFDYPFADWRGPTGGWGNP
jgi:hypothetical protein